MATKEGCGRGTKRSKPIELFGICLEPALVLFGPPSMRCELLGCPTCLGYLSWKDLLFIIDYLQNLLSLSSSLSLLNLNKSSPHPIKFLNSCQAPKAARSTRSLALSLSLEEQARTDSDSEKSTSPIQKLSLPERPLSSTFASFSVISDFRKSIATTRSLSHISLATRPVNLPFVRRVVLPIICAK